MQQQMPQQDQCGNQQQIGQPVMLCPVQYVCSAPAPMILPQPQEEQMQQNQILINVKTPPPWIQNRPQNQVVYVQQIPNNYQPYIQQQMIQNSIYHPQMSYQIQPVLTQDNRQFIQIPNLNQFNMVQNPTTQIVKEETEKMPLLTQMLNQKPISNKAANVSNVTPNMTPTVNMIRPIMQNQQVQTDNVSPNIKGRPRNAPPQIITINPMQQRQIIRKPETVMNVRPTNARSDVPQHIRTKIPSSISVKSINSTRTIIRPFDAMTSPQSFYYDSNRNSLVMPVSTGSKNMMTNTEQYLKQNIHETNPRTVVPMQYPMPVSNVAPFMNMPTTMKNHETGNKDNFKQIVNINAIAQSNLTPTNIQEDINKQPQTEKNTGASTEIEIKTEEKLVRNTVFVQARGRVLNDKEVIQNQSTKRTLDDRFKEEEKEKQDTTLIIEAKNPEEAIHISKKIKVEVTDSILDNNNSSNSSSNGNTNIKTQQARISNLKMYNDNDLQMNTDNVLKTAEDKSKVIKVKNIPLASNQLEEDSKSNSEKVFLDKEKNNQDNRKASNEKTDKVSNNSNVKDESELNNIKRKQEKITVLTHVLEGFIIQESNVAFPIQKPSLEKDKQVRINQEQNNAKSMNIEDNVSDSKGDSRAKLNSKGHNPRRHLNSTIESEKQVEFAVMQKDNPFFNIKKSAVEKWTAEQLSLYLEKHGWTETAAKLLDEEIDGESIILVNKEQLVAIGVPEEHAEVIVTFTAS